ncbi:MAG: heavy-metal-associated domain-containing protein [Synechocystis sp.]|jgi:copper chaperone
MTIQLTVPTIACEACAEAVTKAIHNHDGAAEVSVDVPTKVVTVSSRLSEAELKQSIEAAGHEVA